MHFQLTLPLQHHRNIGIDVGTQSIKLLCLDKRGDNYTFVARALFKSTDFEGIKAALRHRAFKRASIRVSIRSTAIKMHKIELPKAPEKEVDGMVNWALRDALTGGAEKYIVRYMAHTPDKNATLISYQAFVVEKQIIEDHQQKLKSFAIKTDMIEPHIIAHTNFILHTYAPANNEVYALLDCGDSKATFLVVSADRLLSYRFLLGVSGEALTTQISRDLGVNVDRAIELKKILPTSLEPELRARLADTVQRYLSKLATEIQNSIDSYHVQFPRQPITSLLLAGNASSLVGMKEHLRQHIQVPIDHIHAPASVPVKDFVAYAVALGLAL